MGSIEPKNRPSLGIIGPTRGPGIKNCFDLTLERTRYVPSGFDPGNSELIPLLDVVA